MTPASAARWVLPAIAIAIVVFVVLAPLAVVIVHAMSGGVTLYIAALIDAEAQEALELTALVTIIVVTLTTVFGVAAAWALTKYRTRATRVLMTLVDLPLAVSPVVAGMLFVLMFGARGWFGPWLDANGLKIIFATPGIVIATTFVTLPLVARLFLERWSARQS